MRNFDRVYNKLAAVTLAAVACLPWLASLSYPVLGSAFLGALLLLALSLVALSLAGPVLRVRRRTALPWPVLALAAVGAAYVAIVVGLALMMGAAQISERPRNEALQATSAVGIIMLPGQHHDQRASSSALGCALATELA